MKKKPKIPFALQVIPWLFPKIEKLFPTLANKLFIYLFFKPIRYQPPEKEITARKKADQFTLEISTGKIQVYRWGRGPAVLFVHGWAGRGTQFRKFIEPLNNAGFSVVALDGPAHGQSDGDKTNLDEFREALFELVKKTGEVKAAVGHSFGGAALLYSISTGLPVSVLVNIASPTIGNEIINTYLRTLNASEKVGEAFKRYVVQRTGKNFDHFTAMEFIKGVPGELKLMLVHDEEDSEVSIIQPQALVRVFPTARLLVTRGLGHNRILKDEKVIEQIVTFIAQHTSTN